MASQLLPLPLATLFCVSWLSFLKKYHKCMCGQQIFRFELYAKPPEQNKEKKETLISV